MPAFEIYEVLDMKMVHIQEEWNFCWTAKKDLIKVADDYGWTVYHYVAYNGFYEIVEDLEMAKIYCKLRRKRTRRLLTFILSRDFNSCNNLLIQRDNNRNTPLHLLAKLGHYYDQLRDLGAELDWQVLRRQKFHSFGCTPNDWCSNSPTGKGALLHYSLRVQIKHSSEFFFELKF